MRRLLFVSAFATLPLAAEAADLYPTDYSFIQDNVPAASSIVGHLELAAGWQHLHVPSIQGLPVDTSLDADTGLAEAHGRVNVPFAGNWNLEIEAGALFDFDQASNTSSFDCGVGCTGFGITSVTKRTQFDVYGHLWGDWSGFRAGAFGGIRFLGQTAAILGTTTETQDEIVSVGLEGEIDIGKVTLGIQGAYNDLINGREFFDCGGGCEFWSVAAWADLYVSPNTRLGVEAAAWLDILGEDIWSVWGSAEHRFAGTPISAFIRAGYQGDTGPGFETVTALGGIRVLFDGRMTLQRHDRNVPFTFRRPDLRDVFVFLVQIQ
jgi:hypothetical protein